MLTQVGVVLGIMTTQTVGLQFATQSQWRYVLFLSAAFCLGQFVLSGTIAESPVWLSSKGRVEERDRAAHRIWGIKEVDSSVEPLLEDGLESGARTPTGPARHLKIPELFASREYRTPLAVVCFAMLSQQISGV